MLERRTIILFIIIMTKLLDADLLGEHNYLINCTAVQTNKMAERQNLNTNEIEE